MSYQKILLMQSVEDLITKNRKQKIESNPAAQGCEFAHCYAVELTSDQKLMRVRQMVESVASQPFDTNGLAERLIRQVSEFNPDLFLVHPGFVLQAFTNEVMVALKIVKAQFPNLKFGLLNHETSHVHISDPEHFFDEDAELKELIEQISVRAKPLSMPKVIVIPKEFFQGFPLIWYTGPSLN